MIGLILKKIVQLRLKAFNSLVKFLYKTSSNNLIWQAITL
jgi:hypothetical protein